MANKDLNKAKAAKKDEFYTRLEDIELELKHCEMGTVPRAKGGLRSCAAAEERGPPHFVRPRPPPPGYKSSILTFRIVISSPPSLSAHLRLIYSSSSAHLQLIYGSSPAHLSFTPLW